MNFGYGKSDTYTSERFICFTEAAQILGYSSHIKVAEFVKKGLIHTYELPLTNRLRVRKSEILLLKNSNYIENLPDAFKI